MPVVRPRRLRGNVEVRFFGNFRITVGDIVINESSSRARQPWNLLQYLMVHRHKTVTRQQLMEALWPGETSEQPDKALKNLVYRVRTLFAGKGVPFAQDVVLYRNGNYLLNNELPWQFDFEQFEAWEKKAQREANDPVAAVESLLKAIDLYQGDFLSEQIYEDWVLPYNTHYRSRFFRCVRQAVEILEKAGRDEDIERVANQAIAVDPFEEDLHYAYMSALIRQDKKSTALGHYTKVSDLFFREMGVATGDELRELYNELSAAINDVQTDLFSIKDTLREHEVSNDAFYCDFEVFRSLYRLEARAAERTGQSVFVGLLTLREGEREAEESEKLNKCMAALLEAVHQSLRRGDVVSRYSQSQYILMLPTITVENANVVMGRVKSRFKRFCPFDDVTLEVRVQPLDPVMAK